jgi:VanZ family protein
MFWKYNWLVLVWALFIMALCGMPGKDIPHFSWLEALSFDKWVHAGIFFVLTILGIRGLKRQHTFQAIRNTSAWITVIWCILYGGVLELLQEVVFEDRSADLYDFIANTFGVVIAFFSYNLLARRFPYYL